MADGLAGLLGPDLLQADQVGTVHLLGNPNGGFSQPLTDQGMKSGGEGGVEGYGPETAFHPAVPPASPARLEAVGGNWLHHFSPNGGTTAAQADGRKNKLKS